MVLIWVQMPHLTYIFGDYNTIKSKEVCCEVLVKKEMLR